MTVRLFCHLMRREQHPHPHPSPNFSREWRQVRPLSSACPTATALYAVLNGRCLLLLTMLLHMPCNNIRWTIGRCWTVGELWRLRIYTWALDFTISTGTFILDELWARSYSDRLHSATETHMTVTTEWCHIFCNSLFTNNPLTDAT